MKMQRGDVFTNIPHFDGKEAFDELSCMPGGEVRIERIVTKEATPETWYNQAWAEWVMILRGGALLEFDSPPAEERLSAGEWLLIPAERPHRVRECEEGTLWLAVHADTAK